MATFKDQGNAAFKNKDFAAAVELYSQALSQTPTEHTILGNRAAAYHNMQKYTEALADAEKCIEIKPDWSKGFQRKAMAQQALGNLDEAVENYEKACKLDPANTQAKTMMEAAEKQQLAHMMQGMQNMPGMGGAGGMPGGMGGMPGMGGGDGPFSAEALTKLKTNPKIAMHLMDPQFKNMYDMCIANPQMLMQVMQMDPRFMDVFKELTGLDLGKMQEERAKNEEKSEEMQKAAEEARLKREAEEAARRKAEEESALPAEERQRLELVKEAEKVKLQGNEFYKKKDLKKAAELYSKAIEMNPAEIMYYSNLAAVYIEEKRFAEAIEQCDIGIAKAKEGSYDFQKLAKVIARKASAYEKSGDTKTAIVEYKNALLEDNASTIKDSLRRVEKLQKEAEAQAYINPELAEQHKTKGNELFQAGSFPAAIKEFDEGIKRDPKNKAIYSNRCACYLKLMDPHSAVKDAEKALEIDPLFVRAWARKGTAHQMTKEYHKAMEAFDKGLKIDPANKECQEGRNKTMLLINSTSGAGDDNDKDRLAHAMADPEIQAIVADPNIQLILRDLQENPAAGQAALKDPIIMGKIQKLIAAGVLKTA